MSTEETSRPNWPQRQADSAHERYQRNAAKIAADLRSIANQVERDAEVRETFHGAPPHSWAAQQVQHAVLWGLANLNLDGLTNAAAEADAAVVNATDHAIVDGRQYGIVNPEHRGDDSINACLVPTDSKEA